MPNMEPLVWQLIQQRKALYKECWYQSLENLADSILGSLIFVLVLFQL